MTALVDQYSHEELKTCPWCEETKRAHHFYNTPNATTHCRRCHRAYLKKHKHRNPARLRHIRAVGQVTRRHEIAHVIEQAKDAPCSDCGQTFPPRVLHFHHVGEKRFEISKFAREVNRSLDDLREEISRCLLLCANCHALRHEDAA